MISFAGLINLLLAWNFAVIGDSMATHLALVLATGKRGVAITAYISDVDHEGCIVGQRRVGKQMLGMEIVENQTEQNLRGQKNSPFLVATAVWTVDIEVLGTFQQSGLLRMLLTLDSHSIMQIMLVLE